MSLCTLVVRTWEQIHEVDSAQQRLEFEVQATGGLASSQQVCVCYVVTAHSALPPLAIPLRLCSHPPPLLSLPLPSPPNLLCAMSSSLGASADDCATDAIVDVGEERAGRTEWEDALIKHNIMQADTQQQTEDDRQLARTEERAGRDRLADKQLDELDELEDEVDDRAMQQYRSLHTAHTLTQSKPAQHSLSLTRRHQTTSSHLTSLHLTSPRAVTSHPLPVHLRPLHSD